MVENGNGKGVWIGGGVAVALFSLAASFIQNAFTTLSNNVDIAISVANQHGGELNGIRGELESIRLDLRERTADRYRASDAEQDMRALELIIKNHDHLLSKHAHPHTHDDQGEVE